jgi:preprotein translocase subunit SecD
MGGHRRPSIRIVGVVVAVVIAASCSKSSTPTATGPHSTIVFRAEPNTSASDLDAAKSIMEKRVHEIAPNSGITFTVKGDSIVADLPGSITDAQRQAIADASPRGRLAFRPMCLSLQTGLTDEMYTTALSSCGSVAFAGPPGPPDASNSLDLPCGQAGVRAVNAPDDQTIVATDDANNDGEVDACDVLGPAGVGSDAIASAVAAIPQGSWVVEMQLRDTALDAFNTLSEHCYNEDAVCASGATAIVLDGVVQSAPRPQTPRFASTAIEISGAYDERHAENLALILNFGALPVRLHVER